MRMIIFLVNKPYNLTVHDAPSVKRCNTCWLVKTKNISLSTISGEERHGIVHRLDKGTKWSNGCSKKQMKPI